MTEYCPHRSRPEDRVGKIGNVCGFCGGIQVSRDQRWYFTHAFKPNDRVVVHSKRQFERECAARGQKWVGKDELLTNGRPTQPPPFKFSESQKRDLGQHIATEMQKAKNPQLVAKKLKAVEQRAKTPLATGAPVKVN